MAILDTIGTGVQSGATPSVGTFTNYIVQRVTEGDKDVEIEDIDDEDGKLAARLIFKRHAKLHLELVCKTSAAPATDFPKGNMCAITDLTAYYVDDAKIEKVKGATRVSADLSLIGIT